MAKDPRNAAKGKAGGKPKLGPERAEEIKKDEDDFMNNVEAIPVTRKAYRIKVTLLGKMPERLERDLEKAYGKKADEQPA